MAMGVLLKEEMSGWMQLDGEAAPRDFAFDIRAFTTEIFRFSARRWFRGEVALGDSVCRCEGELTLHLKGPHYWLTFNHPELGRLRVEGNKTYGQGGWIRSLITCPMRVTRDGQEIGHAEVVYRESILTFPFRALRLVNERNAWPDTGAMP